MGKRSIRKGKAFERRIARWLSSVLGMEVRRQTDEPQQGNVGDVRVSLSPSTRLVVQAKHQKQPSPWRAIEEAESAADPDDIAVACVRRHGGEDIVVMRPQVFRAMLDAYAGAKMHDLPSEVDGW